MQGETQTVPDRIAKAKEITGITSRALAQAVGQSEQNFRYHATKIDGHPYEWLKTVARRLGCRLEWLAEGAGDFAEVPEPVESRDRALWDGMRTALPQALGWRLGYGCARPALERVLDAYARLNHFDGSDEANYARIGAEVGRAILAPLNAIHVDTDVMHPLLLDTYAAGLAAHLFAFVREMRLQRECVIRAYAQEEEPTRNVALRSSTIPALYSVFLTELDATDYASRAGAPRAAPDLDAVLNWAETLNPPRRPADAEDPQPATQEPTKRGRGRPRKETLNETPRNREQD